MLAFADGTLLVVRVDVEGAERVPTDEPISHAITPTPVVVRRMHHPNGIATLALSPDGERLATGGRDGTVRVYDVAQLVAPSDETPALPELEPPAAPAPEPSDQDPF